MRYLAALLLLATLPLGAAMTKPVKVTGGQVAGVAGRQASITAFKGIPYAAPPVGELRWRAPRPVVAWKGVRKATEFGASCMQTIVEARKPWTYEFMTHNAISEDCLFLNVWTPARTVKDRLPVFVYIYGGGNTEGSGAVPAYDGEGLAGKGIVVVTVNYRLGMLGFFTHPELSKESGVNASGNYALLDLIAALQWVQSNIAAFGGDPRHVTIGGQSAGASNTHSLVASPLAKGLFVGAIAQSGSSVAALAGPRKLAEQEQLGVKLAESKGAKSLAELRKLSWQELSAAPQGPAGLPATPPRFGPVVDGYVLSATYGEIFAQGKQNDVPTLTGINRDENGATPNPDVTAEAFQSRARQRFGADAEEFLRLYPSADEARAREAQNVSSWDAAKMSMLLWTRRRAALAKTPVFTYFWDHTMPGPDAARFGAFHSSEVPYVLNTLDRADRPFTASDRKIADAVSSYWANFIRSGNPNGAGLPLWSPVAEQPLATMEIGDTPGPVPVASDTARQAFWERVLSVLR